MTETDVLSGKISVEDIPRLLREGSARLTEVFNRFDSDGLRRTEIIVDDKLHVITDDKSLPFAVDASGNLKFL